MMRSSFVFAAVALFVVTIVGASCDLFDQVSCSVDSDCPTSSPFCTNGACSKTDGSGREGEGVGEGEGEGGGGACNADSQCGTGLCYDVSDATNLFGKCVPTSTDDATCTQATHLSGSTDRQSGGPVITDGTAAINASASSDCTVSGTAAVQVQVHFLSRTAIDLSTEQVFVIGANDSAPASGGGSIESTDGLSGNAFFFPSGCVDTSNGVVAVKIGDTSPTSNVLCLAVSAP